MANPFLGGGNIRFIPDKVKAKPDLTAAEPSKDDRLRQAALERDLAAADMLEVDNLLDAIDAVIDDQMSGMELPSIPGSEGFCKDDVITWECYKKAKELLRAVPNISYGYDPILGIYGPELVKRVGRYVLNCKDFDPDTFYNQVDSNGQLAVGLGAIGRGDKSEEATEPITDLYDKARANQKDWSIKVLLWEILWGKPEIKTSSNPSFDSESLSDDEKSKIAQGGELPDVINNGRPKRYSDLRWEAYPISSGPVDSANDKRSAARAVNLKDITKTMKNPGRGIPAVTIGFLLPILVGFIGLIPKVLKPVMNLRKKLDNKTKIFKKIPFVGKKIYGVVKVILDAIFYTPAIINNVFIEICIILAMLPKLPNLKQIFEDISNFFSDEESVAGGAGAILMVDNMLNIQPTHGGISLECLEKAQAIVNRVNQEVTS